MLCNLTNSGHVRNVDKSQRFWCLYEPQSLLLACWTSLRNCRLIQCPCTHLNTFRVMNHKQLQFGPTLCQLSRVAAVRPNISTVPVITSSCNSTQHQQCASYNEQLQFGPTPILCRLSRAAAVRPNTNNVPVITSSCNSAQHQQCAGYHEQLQFGPIPILCRL